MGKWKWSVGQWVGGWWSVDLIKPKINVCFALKIIYLKARLLFSFHAAETLWLSCHGQNYFYYFSLLYYYIWRSLLIFLDHFYCFTLREQCTSTKLFLVGIFPKNKNSLFVHFSRSVNSNNLPYLPEIEIKLQINHK